MPEPLYKARYDEQEAEAKKAAMAGAVEGEADGIRYSREAHVPTGNNLKGETLPSAESNLSGGPQGSVEKNGTRKRGKVKERLERIKRYFN